jgi:uncharacterized protein YccT (UPF0319 family)
MKHVFLLTAFTMIFFLQASFAKANIIFNIPDDIRIVAVNGENANITESTILPNGLNQIALYFEGEIGRYSEVERSDVFVILFRAADTTLILQKEKIKNKFQFEEFNRQPTFLLADEKNRTVSFDIDKLVKEGFQLGRNYQQELIVFNGSESPAALSRPPLPSVFKNNVQAAPKKSIQQPTVSSGANPAEQMLKYWYQQADETTRNRFKNWLQEQ